jgi:hypothetical protein
VGRNAVTVVNPKGCGEGPAPAKVAGRLLPTSATIAINVAP